MKVVYKLAKTCQSTIIVTLNQNLLIEFAAVAISSAALVVHARLLAQRQCHILDAHEISFPRRRQQRKRLMGELNLLPRVLIFLDLGRLGTLT